MNTCNKCLLSLPSSYFYADKRKKNGLQGRCKKCCLSSSKSYKDLSQEERDIRYQRTRKSHLKTNYPEELRLSRYSLTPQDYSKMLILQSGVCAICKKPETKTRNDKIVKLAVDHDHSCCNGVTSCGKCVRGLLCHKCNASLGGFNDDVVLLNRAVEYLNTTCGKRTAG